MHPTEPGRNTAGTGKPLTRRQLLASLGAAGVLLATGAGFSGEAAAASFDQSTAAGPFYNVKDYGARGEGRYSEDDAPFIQAAINAASATKGGTVYLPQGEYVIKSSLFLRSNVHLLGAGAGATVIRPGGSNIQMIRVLAEIKHCSVEGLTFEGLGVGSGPLIPLVECGVYVLEAEHVRISRCSFTRITNGVQLVRSRHAVITDNSFLFIVGTDSPYEGFGVIIEGGGSHIVQTNQFKSIFKNAIFINAGSVYSVIADNIIETCKEAAIMMTSKITPCSHHLIQGNMISAAKLGDQEFSCSYGIRMKDYCSYNTIANNVISRSASAGIQLEAADNGGDDKPFGNTITGNTVNKSVRGISVLNGDSNTVKSNEVRGVETGVLLDTIGEGSASSAKQNVVTGNSLFQCSVSAIKVGSARCQGNMVFGNGGFAHAAGLTDSGTDTVTAGF